jgi:hypothetical protein
MLSVAVHKDVAEYQPKIIGKLTARTLISISCALGLSLLTGLYIHFVLGLDVSDFMIVIYAVSLPFWCAGFWQPKGMPFEKFIVLWVQHHFSDNHLLYRPSMIKIGYVKPHYQRKENFYAREEKKFLERKAIEAYSPRAGRVL